MMVARVDGSAVSTVCHESLRRWRLAICQPLAADGTDEGPPVLAVDGHDLLDPALAFAGLRQRVGDAHSPIRHYITELVDD